MTADSTVDRRFFLVLAAIALIYAFLASLHPLLESDLFWQLATGRWVAQHHHVFSTDVFSYTAQGEAWIYPVGSGLFFYAAYLIGGYAPICWIGALACCGAVALLLRRGSAVTAGIAILVVPLIAWRTAPRAEMFTVVLFAAYLSILWQNYQTGQGSLWLLPLLMIAWVNLHLGFMLGLATILAFAGMELLELLFPGARRSEALRRLKRASPWFAVTALATLVNPWGWRIYQALIRQNRAMALHSARIVEWGSVRFNWPALTASLSLRDTKGTFYLLLLIAALAALAALRQRQWGAAILLVGATYLGAQHVRMEALTACVIVVVGGWFLFVAIQQIGSRISSPQMRYALAASVVVALVVLAFARSSDVVTGRRSLATNDRAQSLLTLGTGLSWWFPEGAARFIESADPPGEIFSIYDIGGYLIWRLGPKYRDYIDGRAIPFGPDAFRHEHELLQAPPDSDLWRREADRYNINTIILPVPRFESLMGVPRAFCKSSAWRPVYLDEVSVVFVRRKPETEELIKRFELDCLTALLPAAPLLASRAGSFNQWANAAGVLASLGRNSEALAATEKARRIVPNSSFVPWLRGVIYHIMGLRSDAEREYLTAISLEPGEPPFWFSLATLYKDEGRIPDAIKAQGRAIELSSSPQPWELVKVARLYLDTQQPKAALATFDEAVRSAPPDVLAETGATSFNYHVALGRAAAWRALGDNKRAGDLEDEAVRDLYPHQ